MQHKQIIEKCTLLSNHKITNNHFVATFHAPQISQLAKPGQFIMLKIAPEFFLKRPFSFYEIRPECDQVSVYYEVKGAGTSYMAYQWKLGQQVEIQGPLGNGFDFSGISGVTLVVGGGLGLAPMKAVCDYLRTTEQPYITILGARTKELLKAPLMNFNLNQATTYWCTDDGSYGFKGTVLELYKKLAQQCQFNRVLVCGPEPMLCAFAQLRSSIAELQISWEERMACGVGACMGCTKQLVDGNFTVCKLGPVQILRGELKNGK